MLNLTPWLLLMVVGTLWAAPPSPGPQDHTTGELLVHFHAPLDESSARGFAAAQGMDFVALAKHDNAVLFLCPEGGDCAAQIERLLPLEEVRLAYPNRRLRRSRRLVPGSQTLLERLSHADLALSARESQDPLDPGARLTLEINLHNLGPARAEGIQLSIHPDPSLTPMDNPDLPCSGKAPQVCTPPPLAAGAVYSIHLSYLTTKAGIATSQISVSARQHDPRSHNNLLQVSTHIGSTAQPSADLSLATSITPNPPKIGTSASYRLNITNNGPATATAVQLTNQLPAQFGLARITTTQGECASGNPIRCQLGSLAPGAAAQVTLEGQPSSQTLLSNQAEVTSATADWDSTNNRQTLLSTPILPIAWNDPLFTDQWHLLNQGQGWGPAGVDINVMPAWQQGLSGKGITLAVIDDGVELTHEDLAANLSPDLNWDYNSNDADTSHNAHGTAVAGLIVAQGGNGKGVVGIAHKASLVAIRAENTTDYIEAQALDHHPSIAIYSNSWGPEDGGTTLDRPGPLVEATLKAGVTQGRNGKGVIYCWAAGNGGSLGDNSNYDGYANSRYTIAAAAHTDLGSRAYYSEPGANLLISTPSDGGFLAITTTDRSGSLGYNAQGHYANDFGGTSASTPIACAAVALLLEANPALSWRDVQVLLAVSADQIDPHDPDWQVNGAGYWLNHQYGFGALNVGRAAALAEHWPLLEEEIWVSKTLTPNLPIPDFDPDGVRSSVSIAEDLYIESAEITFNAKDHPYWGDLEITLISPSGSRSRLAEEHASGRFNDYYDNWTFVSKRHLGENARGTWTLEVKDLGEGDQGTLLSWGLKLYGTANPPSIPSLPGAADLTLAASLQATDYRLRVRNNGPDDAENVIVTITPPSAALSLSSSQGSCSGSQPVTCSLGAMYANREALISARFSNPPSAPVNAHISGLPSDPSPANNYSQVTAASGEATQVARLNLTLSGSGSGRITSSDRQINCTANCVADITQGETLQLSATASERSNFQRWTGACSGTSPNCTITLTEPLQAEAIFRLDLPGLFH